MKVIFMGTPDFSVGTLDAIIKAGHIVQCVFSQPDKPQGRKMLLFPTPVKKYAVDHNIPVYQPSSLKTGEALDIIKQYNPDIIVVVAYGKILPKEILCYPKYGCVNVHASLLPKYRGASPIQWSIICGDNETGVSTMYMDEGMDTGDILLTEKIPILNTDTAESMFDKLSEIGANLLCRTLEKLSDNTIIPIKQDEKSATYAPIIKKEMGHIDFNLSAQKIDCLIRGLYPWPGAFFFMNGKRVKVISAIAEQMTTSFKPGYIVSVKNGLFIACGKNSVISILTLQPEGKKMMSGSDFVNGCRLEKGCNIIG